MSNAKRYYPDADYRIRFVGQDGKLQERTFCSYANDLGAAMKYAMHDLKPKRIIALEALNGHILDTDYKEYYDEQYKYPRNKKEAYPETTFRVFGYIQRSSDWIVYAPIVDGRPVLNQGDGVQVFETLPMNRQDAFGYFKELRKKSPLATPKNLRDGANLLSVAIVELRADTLKLHHWHDSFYCYGDSLLASFKTDSDYYSQPEELVEQLNKLAY